MNQYWKYFISLAFVAFSGGHTYAQFTLGAEVRPRGEYRHGFRSLADVDQDAAFFIDQRTRLNVGLKKENVSIFIQFQDIRTWGSQSQLSSADGLTTLHQAWGEFAMGKKLSFRAGRQEWSYDTHRILGNVGWAQQARSHDGALLKFKGSESFTAHLGGAFNQDSPKSVGTIYTVPSSYKTMLFIWLNKKFSDQLAASVLFLNNGMQPLIRDSVGNVTDWVDRYSQTIGTHINYKKQKVGVTGWFYYQMGENPVVGHRDIQAINAAIELAFKATETLTVKAGAEYLSGQSQTDTSSSYTDINHAFTPFYGTNHKFNGFMDYFYVGNHGNSVGLIDPYVKLHVKKGKINAGIDAHFFQAAAAVMDPVALAETGEISEMSSSLGTEIDLSFGAKINQDVMLKAGYSHLIATDTMEALKGGDANETQNWGYVMIIFKPELLKRDIKTNGGADK
jgi:hypothetical protein